MRMCCVYARDNCCSNSLLDLHCTHMLLGLTNNVFLEDVYKSSEVLQQLTAVLTELDFN